MYIYTYMNAYSHVHMYVYIYQRYIYGKMHMYIYILICIHVSVRMFIFTWIYVIYMYIYTLVCVCVWSSQADVNQSRFAVSREWVIACHMNEYRVAKTHSILEGAGHFSQKEPLIIGLFCGKWPMKIRHPMTLRHSVISSAHAGAWLSHCMHRTETSQT